MSNTDAFRTPVELFGPLFARVQERGIFRDGKTFVDARPKRSVASIMADFEKLDDDSRIGDFVQANFDLPPIPDPTNNGRPALPLRAYIRSLWPALSRDPFKSGLDGSALPVGHRHVLPGGRFREIYYWDSFFTLLGLLRDGEDVLAAGVVDTMTDLIERHDHVPNGARTYYLSRSQPPLYFMMVGLMRHATPFAERRYVEAIKREYRWWMSGAEDLAPGESARRVVRLSDGSLLNRYWDDRCLPREECWREDMATADESGRRAAEVYRDLRAGAESGWDFSSRWFNGCSLASLATTSILPVDLNAFLFGIETAIAEWSGEADEKEFAQLAERRRDAMQRHMWDEQAGRFGDLDIADEALRPNETAAALAPLLTGVATHEQAEATALFVRERMLAPGGMRTTQVDSGQQWDRPNGWAPLQWIAVEGLRRYGQTDLARDIALRWIGTVEKVYELTGFNHEKYDIESIGVGAGGEYDPQIGFGWTNGVTAHFIDTYGN